MVSRKPARAKATPPGADEVDAYMRKLDHPLKPALEAVRRIILGADPRVREGFKWNAPSFRVDEYFATAGLRPQGYLQVVFHRGAKAKDNSAEVRIDDPLGLLEWHAKDRCSAKFRDLKEVQARADALRDVVIRWIRRM